eukprot:scaffold50399_cov86-Phaeocystis_antarctica.AAC.7
MARPSPTPCRVCYSRCVSNKSLTSGKKISRGCAPDPLTPVRYGVCLRGAAVRRYERRPAALASAKAFLPPRAQRRRSRRAPCQVLVMEAVEENGMTSGCTAKVRRRCCSSSAAARWRHVAAARRRGIGGQRVGGAVGGAVAAS